MKEHALRLAGPQVSAALTDLLDRCQSPEDIVAHFDYWLRVLLLSPQGSIEAPPLAAHLVRLLRPSA